jgi:hypothetical protein
MGLRVRWLPAAAREEAGEVWAAIDAQRTDCRACSSWTWTRTWLAHFGDVEHGFAVAEDAKGPAGIALVCHGPQSALRPATLHLGTAGWPGSEVYVEDNRLAALPDRRDAFAGALLGALRARPGWTRLVLDGFAAEDAAALLGHLPRAEVRREPSPFFDLAAARAAGHGDEVAASLRAGPRARLRRTLRAFGPLHEDWAEDATSARTILEELVALHQARWTARGEPGAFADARVLAFHRDLVGELAGAGGVVLFRLRDSAGATIGCVYAFADAGTVLFYQGGFAASNDNRRRPGLATHARCLQACSDRGWDRYDFLAGEGRYKRELSTGERELVWATADRPGVRTSVDRARRGARAAARRLWRGGPPGSG